MLFNLVPQYKRSNQCINITVTWRNRHDVENPRQLDCLFNNLFRVQQWEHQNRTGNAENVSMPWRHHGRTCQGNHTDRRSIVDLFPRILNYRYCTHVGEYATTWGSSKNKMPDILRITFLTAFSWMKKLWYGDSIFNAIVPTVQKLMALCRICGRQ